MRVRQAILLVLTFQLVQSFYLQSESSIGESIRKVYEKQCKTFNIFIIKSIEHSSDSTWNSLVHETSSALGRNCSIQVEDVGHVKELELARRRTAIIFIDTFESFLTFHRKFSQEYFSFSGYFLIVMKSDLKTEIEKIFKIVWTTMVYNFNVMVYEKYGNASLYTFMPFSDGICNNIIPIKINEFDIKTRQWKMKTFFPFKLKNLQRCPIRVGTYESSPGLILKVTDNVTSLHGFEGNLFNDIANQLNFTMDIKVVDYGAGNFYENGSSTGLVEKLIHNQFDLIMSLMSSNYLRGVYLTPTKSYFVDKMIVIIPSDHFLDPFLKLFYVFDRRLWLSLFAILGVSVVFIEIVKLLFPKFSKMFLNEIRMPFLTIITAFVGGSEARTPKKDFARIILAMFLIFFMVIRSVYQGGLFNILKKDVRVNQIKTIDDINNLEYTFYIIQSIDVKTKEMTIFKR